PCEPTLCDVCLVHYSKSPRRRRQVVPRRLLVDDGRPRPCSRPRGGGEAEARRHPKGAALGGRNGAERPARREDCGSGRAVPGPDGTVRPATETRERGASMTSGAT